MGLEVLARGERWGREPTISAGVTICCGHQCEKCRNLGDALTALPWPTVCAIYRASVDQQRTEFDTIRSGDSLLAQPPREQTMETQFGGFALGSQGDYYTFCGGGGKCAIC